MRRLATLLVVAAALFGAASAGAVLSGENGRILFTSGRDGTDATARLYLLPVPFVDGGGTVSPPVTPAIGQHRHPTWSPDRTKIAYARGDPGTGIFDIFVQDIAAGTPPVQITPTDNLSADRPAWSPDGTRIAYEHQPTMGSPLRQILVQPADDLVPPFTTTEVTPAAAPFEGKPAWSPDSSTIYFHRGDPSDAATNSDIHRVPATGGLQTLAVADSGISEFQPSISPDGGRICFAIGNGGFNATADVMVAPLTSPPSGGTVVSFSLIAADYNCTWSPDGEMIAYATGAFSTGRLVMVRADGTSLAPIELAQDAGGNRFDGNPDWAPDGRPDCPDSTITTPFETPVTFTLTCTDTGPAYERTDVREFAGSDPANGTLQQTVAGDPFTYTPNPGFSGTDTFLVRSFDEFGFGTDTGTVTIEVGPPPPQPPPPPPGPQPQPQPPPPPPTRVRCAGLVPTIVGTPRNDVLRGTRRRDVIVGLGGDDTIRGLAGDDVICGGPGRDRIFGDDGRDRAHGQGGDDRIAGGRGDDRLTGGPGRDLIIGGAGRNVLIGGLGVDTCPRSLGRDSRSGCELPRRRPARVR